MIHLTTLTPCKRLRSFITFLPGFFLDLYFVRDLDSIIKRRFLYTCSTFQSVSDTANEEILTESCHVIAS